MKIFFTSSMGVLGSALIGQLIEKKHTLYCQEKITGPQNSTQKCKLDHGLSSESDSPFEGVIYLAEEFPVNWKWSRPQTEKYFQQTIHHTHSLASQLANSFHKPKVFIVLSNVGYYGDRSDRHVDETSFVGDSSYAEIFRKLEIATQPAQQAGIRVIILRSGLILGNHIDERLRLFLPHNHFFSGIWGTGTQYLSWISSDDAVEAIEFMLHQTSIKGPVNLTSPTPLVNRELTSLMASSNFSRFRATPTWMTRLLYEHITCSLLLTSCRAIPKKLLSSGFNFKNKTLEEFIL